jgi:hypothetical protein
MIELERITDAVRDVLAHWAFRMEGLHLHTAGTRKTVPKHGSHFLAVNSGMGPAGGAGAGGQGATRWRELIAFAQRGPMLQGPRALYNSGSMPPRLPTT